ncbi:thiamine phosphate synthase [Kiloniella laminariae]|uniref:Thiamine-phosphate synthase n=1 Tax=Kiloniella laminariae TaxID=454162 RepID=A0ABT4LLY8_9PROT|nr:thiamine phosphate synthase [Kiloniella laminariae]MCZ4282124.1 thiamine phosphate synthase [Kiloniella laminariae]
MIEPFYQIVDDVKWLPRFLPLGLKLVQLRIKDKEQDDVRAQIRQARELCREYKTQLVVNDYWQLALELGCDFIHLGQEDLDQADLPKIRQAGLKLGISTHDEAELDRALALSPDYIALGPVYPTILKQMSWAPQGAENVRRWKARVGKVPLVAIGGLSVERAPDIYKAGADCLCVVTDVLYHPNPEERLQQWLEIVI